MKTAQPKATGMISQQVWRCRRDTRFQETWARVGGEEKVACVNKGFLNFLHASSTAVQDLQKRTRARGGGNNMVL